MAKAYVVFNITMLFLFGYFASCTDGNRVKDIYTQKDKKSACSNFEILVNLKNKNLHLGTINTLFISNDSINLDSISMETNNGSINLANIKSTKQFELIPEKEGKLELVIKHSNVVSQIENFYVRKSADPQLLLFGKYPSGKISKMSLKNYIKAPLIDSIFQWKSISSLSKIDTIQVISFQTTVLYKSGQRETFKTISIEYLLNSIKMLEPGDILLFHEIKIKNSLENFIRNIDNPVFFIE